MTSHDRRGPGPTRGIQDGILEAEAAREPLAVWGYLEGDAPVGRDRSIGPLVTGHLREGEGDLGMASRERQLLHLALRERMAPRGAYP